MDRRHARSTRRTLLRSGLLLPFGTRLQEATPAPDLAGGMLRVLIPAHPLQAYNDAIRTLANDWGAAQGVTVRVDIIPPGDLPSAVGVELASGEGHDLIGTAMPLLHRAETLRDLGSLYQRAEAAYGPAADPCAAATLLPDGRRPAFSIAYAPAPMIYRHSIWDAYGLPNGPATWDQVRDTGAQIWASEGMNVGLGLAPEPGSERVATMLLAAFGGRMLDGAGEVALASGETVAAVTFMAGLFAEAMSPESLDWDTARPARLLQDGITSIINDDISALRRAQTRDTTLAADLLLAPPPAGPSGTTPTALPTSFRAFHIPRFAANPDAAEAFLLMLVESSEALVGSGQLSDRPAYGSLVPGLVQAGGWLDADPYGSEPREKLAMLKESAAWTAAPRGPVETAAHAEYLLARMMAEAARGDHSPEDAVARAAARLDQLR